MLKFGMIAGAVLVAHSGIAAANDWTGPFQGSAKGATAFPSEITFPDSNGELSPPSATNPLPTKQGTYTVLGYQQITSLSSAATLTVPTGATIAVIEVNSAGQSVRWRDDGTAPTASVGIELLPGAQLTYSGSLSAIQFIQTAASATLNVSYYK